MSDSEITRLRPEIFADSSAMSVPLTFTENADGFFSITERAFLKLRVMVLPSLETSATRNFGPVRSSWLAPVMVELLVTGEPLNVSASLPCISWIAFASLAFVAPSDSDFVD